MIRGRLVKGLVILAVLALLSLLATGCTSALQGLIGMDRGGANHNQQVTALDSQDDSGDGDGAQVEQLQGREKSKAVWGAFRDAEVRQLAAQLKQQGLRMNLWKAQAYEVKSTEESETEAQALGMEVTGDEGDDTGTLVDVPLGDSGHLLQVDEGDADHTWAELEAGEDGGTELTYIDTEEEAHFIIPDEGTEQGLLEALQQDPAYQGLLDELQAQGASIADVQVVIDEDTGEAHFLVEASHDEEAQGQWFGAGFRRPRIDGTYSLHFPVKRVDGSRKFKPVSPAVRRPVRELLEDRHSRTRLAVLYGGRRHDTSRLKRAVFWHEFIRHTKLAVDVTKVWLGDIKDKRAFGKPDDPFTYKIRLKRAPWLPTKLQLELLDGCDHGIWVPKETQVVLPGQVEVVWDSIDMSGYWDKDVGGKICKFRMKDLQNGKVFGPHDGPKLWKAISKEDISQIHHVLASVSTTPSQNTDEPPAAFLYGRDMNYMFYGFKKLDAAMIQELTSMVPQEVIGGGEELVQVSDRVLQILKTIATAADREAELEKYKDDPEFQAFLSDLELWAEFKNFTLDEILDMLFNFLDPFTNIITSHSTFNPDIALAIIKYLGAEGAAAIAEVYYYMLQNYSFNPFAYGPGDEVARSNMVRMFIEDLQQLIDTIKEGCNRMCIPSDLLANLKRRLEELLLRKENWDRQAFNTLRTEVAVAAGLAANKWNLVSLWQNTGATTIDIIAFKEVPGLGKTTVFAEVLWNGDFNPVTVPQKISEYIDYAKDHKPVTDSDTQVVQVIGVGTAPYTTAQVESWLAEFKDSGMPVLVVWIDYSGIGQIRYAYVNMSKSQAQALLESEGFSGCSNGTCESYNGDLQGLANGIYIQGSNPDDPPVGDGNDDSPICFGGYCIESKRLQYVTGHKDR